MRDLSYGEIRNWLTRHDKSASISVLNDGLGLLAVLTVLGLGVTPALITLAADLLKIKSELGTSVKRLLSRFNLETQNSPSDRVQQMRVAYGLIACSAFFEAVERCMPGAMREFHLTKEDRTRLAASATGRTELRRQQVPGDLTSDLWTQPLLPFPHPTDNWDQQQRELSALFEALAVGLVAFLPCLAHWDEMNETARTTQINACKTVPTEALNCFEAQYTVLAADCHEFSVWARRQEYVMGQRRLDWGMHQLEQTIRSLYGYFQERESEESSTALRAWYTTQINKPILRERELSDDLPSGVTLPLKTDAFIPQYFKVTRYDPETPIGSEELWKSLPRREDLPDFLWGYIHSPQSELHPLVILGHPGSGKSLLTEIFAARLAASPFTPIRLVLRDITPDARIREQIDEQIARDIDPAVRWSHLRPTFATHPAVLIFDGYDELLQASGHVFANYLVDIQEFQHDEKDRSQAGVRTIITSRSTLIDKARLPKGATVLRLLAFDEQQQGKWVDTWNAVNATGFRDNGITPFAIPATPAVLELAEQPLLLLMLAIYDSYGNPLRARTTFSRAALYSELVGLFVHRECQKSQTFRDLTDDQQASTLTRLRKRLGVCALGMFNRQRLSITHQELEEDLSQFGLSLLEPDYVKRLGEADALFGGFFFVHRSQAMGADGQTTDARRVAYEFLHNTFGEYLCAEFLLGRVFELAGDLTAMKLSPRMATYRERLLGDPNQLEKSWYACWISTSFNTRPVVVEMIQEIVRSGRDDNVRVGSDGIREFDDLIHQHLACMLGGDVVPGAMIELYSSSHRALPLLSRIATYSFNLLVVQCALHGDDYYADYRRLAEYVGKQDPWDRLVHLWLAALPDGAQWPIGGLLYVERSTEGVHLRLRARFSTEIASSSTKAFGELGLKIADDLREETKDWSQKLLAMLVHSLGNHVAALHMRAENWSESRREEDGRALKGELRRIDQFLKGLWGFGNVGSGGRLDVSPRRVSLEGVLASVSEMFAPEAEKSGVAVRVKCMEGLHLSVDSALLEQALYNVVDNSLAASDRGGVITLEGLVGTPEEVVILVRDQGRGIPEAVRSQLFMGGVTTKATGTGIGLYITKKIVEALGGSIALTSSFDEGTTVTVVLPMSGANRDLSGAGSRAPRG